MRHLNYLLVLVMAGSMSAFGCGDGDSVPALSAGGQAGDAGSGAKGGSAGRGGSGAAGRGGSGSAGKGGSGTAGELGTAGEVGTAGEGGSGTGGEGGGSAGKGGSAGSSGSAGAITGGTGGTGGAVGGTGGAVGGAGGAVGGAGGAVGGAGGAVGGAGGAVGGAGGAVGGAGGIGGAAGGSAGQAPGTGSLQVTVSGVPTGSTASVAVTGPGGFNQSIATTTTLPGLAVGSYAVAAPPIPVPGTQVDTAFDAAVTGSPANVTSAATANASVSYAKRPGTGMLWVTNWVSRSLFGFDQAQLAKTTVQTDLPAVSLSLAGFPAGTTTIPVAFSTKGEAWVGTCKNSATPQVLSKFSPSKIGANSSPTADVTITLPATDASYDCVTALTFDGAGNLWVGTYHGGHILKYNASDLATTGTPAPAVNLTNSALFNGIVDLQFDTSGNLFVAAFNKPVVSRLSAAQLTASSAAIVPTVQLSMAADANVGGLTLDKTGTLWVTDYNNGFVLSFPSSLTGTTGTPTPAVKLTVGNGPEQLTFDNAGNLWVAAYDSSQVFAFAPSSITTTGTPTPLTSMTGGVALNSTYGVRFNPGTH